MTEYLLALLGHPLSHSLSPILHKAALQSAGLKGNYQLFDIAPENFTTELKSIIDSGINGFNITIPYKQHIYRLCSHKTDEAKLSNAVNTVKVDRAGKLSGHNTDIIGFKIAFSEAFGMDLQNKTALIIGAGGAAKAVVVALAQMGITKIKVKARDPQKVQSFISQMQTNLSQTKDCNSCSIICADNKNYTDEVALVVNASSLGLFNEPAPVWLTELVDKLSSVCLCFDLVYQKNGSMPLFNQIAASKNLKTIDGLPMLIHQARHAFKFWTGINVPAQVMRRALKLTLNA